MISVAILACAPSGGGSGYVGPLDIVSGAVVAYSQRAMSAASRGSALFTFRENSGNTTQSFASDATTGLPSIAAINAFLNGAAGFYAAWQDQSGNASHLLQSTSGLQPALVVAGPGSLPVPYSGGAGAGKSIMASAGDVTLPAGGASFYTVLKGAAPGQELVWAIAGPSFSPDVYMQNSSGSTYWADYANNGPALQAATPTVDPTDGNTHIIYGSLAATAAYLSIDGVSQDTAGSTLGDFLQSVAPFVFGDDTTDGSDAPWLYETCEIVLWPSVLSTMGRNLVIANVAAAYGVTLA